MRSFLMLLCIALWSCQTTKAKEEVPQSNGEGRSYEGSCWGIEDSLYKIYNMEGPKSVIVEACIEHMQFHIIVGPEEEILEQLLKPESAIIACPRDIFTEEADKTIKTIIETMREKDEA